MIKYNKAIEEGVSKRNIEDLRIALAVIIMYNKSFKTGEFEDSLSYIKENNINIYEDYDGGELFSNKGEFTERDFDEAYFALENNFCKERVKDVRRIGQALYSELYDRNKESENSRKEEMKYDNGKYSSSQGFKSNISANKNSNSKEKLKPEKKLIYAAVGAVAVIIAIILKVKN